MELTTGCHVGTTFERVQNVRPQWGTNWFPRNKLVLGGGDDKNLTLVLYKSPVYVQCIKDAYCICGIKILGGMCLGRVVQLVGALSHKPEGCGFDSWSGDIP